VGRTNDFFVSVRTLSFWPKWARNIETVHLDLPRTIFTKHTHGPTVWPHWKVFSISLVRASVYAPSSGWNVWIYTRWHRAVLFEFFVGRGLSRTELWPELPPYQVQELKERLRKASRTK
jgi:hypothetical protein